MGQIPLPSSARVRYFLALLAVALGIAARFLFAALGAHRVPYLPFYPFLVVAAFAGGLGPGILALVLFAILGALGIGDSAPDHLSWLLFVGGAAVVTAISAGVRQARERAAGAAAVLQATFDALHQPVLVFDAPAQRGVLGGGILGGSKPDRAQGGGGGGGAIKANAAALRVLGVRQLPGGPEEYRRRIMALRPRRPDGTPIDFSELPSRRALQGQVVGPEEILLQDSFGQDIVFEVSGIPLRQGNRVVGAVAVLHEITQRKRDEESLRAALQRLDAHMSNSPLAVVEFDASFRISRWSDEAERLFGWSAREVVGKAISDLPWVHEADARGVAHIAADMLSGRQPRNLHFNRNYRKDGSVVDCEWYNSALYDAQGHMTSILSLILDVTERERRGAALQREQDAKDRFLAVLSHELRNPLTPALAAAVSLEADAGLPTQVREDAAIIRRNIELETRLIDDLLDITRIARGKLSLHPEPVDLVAILLRTVDICRADADSRSIDIHLVTRPVPRAVHGDPARLQQIFWNLLKNAIKFTPAGGRIEVAASAEDDRVTIRIADSGEGIDPEYLAGIFEPFQQQPGHATRGGLGLGLSICKSLVDMHQGTISATSLGRGQGAVFTVELPLCEESLPLCPAEPFFSQRQIASIPPVITPPALASNADGEGGPSTPTVRLLLVEDDRDTTRVMSRLLRSLGYDVSTAGTIHDALTLAQEARFDVIISDLGLPDGSGCDLLPHLPAGQKAIAVSGYGSREDLERSRAAGFLEHLIKPIHVPALEAALLRLLAATPPAPAGPPAPTRESLTS